jgi:hypothetical protein
MADINRRRLLAVVLPGAVVTAAGVTAITTISLSVASSARAETMPPAAPDRMRAPKVGDVKDRAPTDISAWHRRWHRPRRRRVCWWRRGRRVCAWRWV